MIETRVVNIRDHVPGAVYIGRPSRWGNPFRLGLGASKRDRDRVIQSYREWLRTQPELVTEIQVKLQGKTLECFCAPLACHGDVLAAVADGEAP